ncbi:Na+/Pi-cotransporter [Peptococcaceae bacterium CEB3]|nr:Na+/Pi-cotransporter [Peptococcaceae bacterium CEB3]
MPLFVLGLFALLGGMHTLRQGLQALAASRLRRALLWMTQTPWRGFWSGTLATALIQSSNILTVMAVSLVDAGLLPFAGALYLILGSNIGTTVTTQLLTLPLNRFSVYALLLGALGYLFLPKRKRFLGLTLLGFGLLFLGLMIMETGLRPLADNAGIQNLLHNLGNNRLHGVLAGALLSALLQSSGATTGIVMLLTRQGAITLPTAIAFVFGANIGTCGTALVASLGAKRAAQRVALFHILLNVFGVLCFLPFLVPLANLLNLLGGNPDRQVANAHTLFNVISSLLAFPLTPYAGKFLDRILP